MVSVLAVGAAVLGGATDDALMVVPASPGPLQTRSLVPLPPGLVPPLDARPGGSAPRAVATPGSALRYPGEQQPGAGAPAPEAGQTGRPAAEPRQVGPPATRPYTEAPESDSYPEFCVSGRMIDVDGYRLCATTESQNSVRSGEVLNVHLSLCSSRVNTQRYTMAFASGREHDVQVRRAGTADDFVWTWSRRHSFPQGPHERALDPGYCLGWRTAWDTRDDSGRLVPPGAYAVDASVELNGRTGVWSVPVTVTAR
jgi:hypothetical protein